MNSDRPILKVSLEIIALAVCVLIACSCISFNIYDWPSSYAWPHNSPISNWCGHLGSFLAYHSLYFVGAGVYVVMLSLAGYFVLRLMNIEYSQIILRIIGLVLLATAVSTFVSLVRSDTSNGFPVGNGGILGIATATFLQTHMATLGTYIIVLSCGFVGAFLLADTLVMMVLRWLGVGSGKALGAAGSAVAAAYERSEQLSAIWEKLSQRSEEKAKPAPKKKLRPSIALEPDDEPIKTSKKHDMLMEDELEESEGEKKKKGMFRIKRKKKKKFKIAPPAPVDINSDEPQAITQQITAGAIQSGETVAGAYVEDELNEYEFPPVDLLHEPEYGFTDVQERMVKEKAFGLEALLKEFGIEANVVNAEPGPAITMYELELAAGIKVSQITNLSNDIARALGAPSVRVVAPLPGKHTIGIEVPNSQREIVRLKDLIERAGSKSNRMHIPLYLGKDSAGEALISDLASMPHMLIAGTTGSGKSVCINSIITSILMKKRPDEVKLILIDPKMVEMTAFETLPHLMCPIVTETRRAEQILEWATTKMDERYSILSEARVRNISDFNKLGAEEVIRRFDPSTPEEEAKLPKKLTYIVIVVDELADLMMTAGKEIEAYIVRLAQKSRAVGIHLVLATQRPQATVVTGLIKSNMPCRISFRVAGRMDSRIILDQNGGETLLGQGDMLFLRPGTSDLVRSQGAFLDDAEVHAVVDHIKEYAKPSFHPELMQLNRVDMANMKKDDMFDEAVDIVLETKRGSVSLLQRRLGVGYARASRMIEMMASSGILGEYKGSQAREVLLSNDDWERIKKQQALDSAAGYSDLQDEDDTSVEADQGEEEVEEYEYEDVEEDEYKEEYEDDDEYEDEEEYDSPVEEIEEYEEK